MKKIISFLLVLTLILSITAVPGYAYRGNGFTPPGLEKKGGLPPGISKFMDLKEVDWARSAIEKMADKGILKGIAENKFAPNKPVTKAEALAMILRALDYEEMIQEELTAIQEGKKKSKIKDVAQEWALGYISIAKDRDILTDDEELTWKNLNKPVQRQEVAKYLIRALELEAEAEDHKESALPFKDADAVKSEYRGYVYVAYDENIMRGDHKNIFQPNKPVTRAEMAVLVEKLHDYGGNPGENTTRVIEGKLIRIEDESTLIIRVNNIEREYSIDADVKVYIDNRLKDLEDLQRNKTIKIIVKEGNIVEIRWNSDVIVEGDVFEGKITTLNNTDRKIGVVKGSVERLFTLNRDTQIKMNGETTTFSRLAVDMNVKITLKDDQVKLVEVTENVREDLSGILTGVNRSMKEITMKSGTTERTIKINLDAVIRVDGERATINDLMPKMEVQVEVNNNKIDRIDAYVVESRYTGELVEKYMGSVYRLVLRTDGKNKTYIVDKDVTVIEEGDADFITFEDLTLGSEITLTLKNEIVVKIVIED